MIMVDIRTRTSDSDARHTTVFCIWNDPRIMHIAVVPAFRAYAKSLWKAFTGLVCVANKRKFKPHLKLCFPRAFARMVIVVLFALVRMRLSNHRTLFMFAMLIFIHDLSVPPRLLVGSCGISPRVGVACCCKMSSRIVEHCFQRNGSCVNKHISPKASFENL